MFKFVAILCGLGVWICAWHRDGARRLARDYSRPEPFAGVLEKCLIRFPAGEAKTDGMLGANSEGLYLSSSAEAIEMSKRWMGKRYYVVRTPILIPWDQMQYCEAKFPLQEYVRFTVPSNKATFFVPRETADLLLGRAGRRLPSD